MSKKILLNTVAALSLSMVVAACDMSTPSQIQTGKIQLREQYETVMLSADKVNEDKVQELVKDYRNNGNGPMTLLVSYNEASASEGKDARIIAQKYKRALSKEGLKNVDIEAVPMAGRYQGGQVIVSYRALQASAPDGCGRLPGHTGSTNREGIEEYTMGCEVQDLMSKMIARPADLLGRSGTPDGVSRRQGGVTEGYQSGAPNEALDGLRASEVGLE